MDSENEILHRSDFSNDRVSSWSIVASWFKSWLPEKSSKLSEPNPKQRIAELIIKELTWQMKLIEYNRQEREKERRKQISGVDYSWLVTSKPKFPSIPDFKRLELEDLCYRLDPEDCTEVIRSMWRICLNDPPAIDLPDMLQTILLSRIQEKRSQQSFLSSSFSSTSLGDWSRWLSSSVLSLFSGHAERTSGFSQQELNKFDSLEMVEMGVEPVEV